MKKLDSMPERMKRLDEVIIPHVTQKIRSEWLKKTMEHPEARLYLFADIKFEPEGSMLDRAASLVASVMHAQGKQFGNKILNLAHNIVDAQELKEKKLPLRQKKQKKEQGISTKAKSK